MGGRGVNGRFAGRAVRWRRVAAVVTEPTALRIAFAADDAERAAAYQQVFDYPESETAFVPLTRPSAVGRRAGHPRPSGFEVPVTESDLPLRAVEATR
ncbi:MAG: hypothetical protein ACRDZO_06340 [Egibacteraceae bacterium]